MLLKSPSSLDVDEVHIKRDSSVVDTAKVIGCSCMQTHCLSKLTVSRVSTSSLCPLCVCAAVVGMPRVVPDQREKFDNDELFRKLSRESEVRYTGHLDKSLTERQLRLQAECQEGHASVAFVNTGINLHLQFESNAWSSRREDRLPTSEFVDFDRESGKVHLKSQFIMNGVCVVWRGWLDLYRLDGTARLEYDHDRAAVEDAVLRQQIEQYNQAVSRMHFQQQQQNQRYRSPNGSSSVDAAMEADVAQALLDRAVTSAATTTTSSSSSFTSAITSGFHKPLS